MSDEIDLQVAIINAAIEIVKHSTDHGLIEKSTSYFPRAYESIVKAVNDPKNKIKPA